MKKLSIIVTTEILDTSIAIMALIDRTGHSVNFKCPNEFSTTLLPPVFDLLVTDLHPLDWKGSVDIGNFICNSGPPRENRKLYIFSSVEVGRCKPSLQSRPLYCLGALEMPVDSEEFKRFLQVFGCGNGTQLC